MGFKITECEDVTPPVNVLDPTKDRFIEDIGMMYSDAIKQGLLQHPSDIKADRLKEYALLAAKHLIPQGIDIPPPEIVFEIGGIPMLTKKSISLLIAKAKAGKTTVAAWIIAQAIQVGIRVLWVDTEQGLYYGSRTQSWILSIAGLQTSENLSFYDLKIHPPDIRIHIIESLMQTGQYDLIVIDGVRDLVFDINSPEEATHTATNLMRWAEVFNCHILTILHQNKGNDHARGHLGSEMVNKAETVIKVGQNDLKEIVVEPEFTRGKPFDVFALNRDENGTPYMVENWSSSNEEGTPIRRKLDLPTEVPSVLHHSVLTKVFKNDEELKSTDFLNSFMAAWSTVSYEPKKDPMNLSRAKVFHSFYVQEGYITQLKGQKGNMTLNKLADKVELVSEEQLVNQLF
ncbi:AAA family ATPase [Pedobacter sp. SAFR-022]|uniref:AAA family ATPase n=1 Tax=Pedobacter sp. SAFR-022 TaxID=3436861 RepID=UPI003F823A63